MKFKYKILLFLFILCVVVYADNSITTCQNIIKWKQKYDCYEENILNESESCNGEIKWNLTNSTLGLVDVEFHPCGHSNLEIILKVQESGENICDINGTWNRHSSYNYRRFQNDRNDLPKCSESVKIHLEYMFSGCYEIEIDALYANGYVRENRSTKYLKTDYVKHVIGEEDVTPQHQQRYTDNKTYLTTKLKYPQYSKMVELCFHLENNIDNKRLVWNISCPVENIKNNCRITVHGRKEIACSLKTLVNNEFVVDCYLFGLTPGSYLFEKFIVNEPIRCNTLENTIWGFKDCHWIHSLNLTEENLISSNQIPTNNSSIYVIGISTLVLTSVILILIYFLYKKIQRNKLINTIPTVVYDAEATDDYFEETLIDTNKVLLLYARDCKIFMEVMSSFRRMLQIAENYQIFDLHDNARHSKILTENQKIWLHRKIMDTDMKIVLVVSECGDYLIENQSTYKEPKCMDSLYNYGVRILLQNSHLFSCNKLFVTKFSFFDESRATSILSPDRRYNLDVLDNVKILVNGLLSNIHLEEKSAIFKECLQFNAKCHRLVEFVNYNPNYLADILKIT